MNPVIAGRRQVLDDAWLERLGVPRRDTGIGMTSPEVTELTRQLDLGALREYRDAVGRRTHEVVGAFAAPDWQGTVETEGLERAATDGAFGSRGELLVKAFSGSPRAGLITGIALAHPSQHIGEANTVRSAGGFGTGI